MALCCKLSVKSFHAFMISIVMSGIYPDIGTYSLSSHVYLSVHAHVTAHVTAHADVYIYFLIKKDTTVCV